MNSLFNINIKPIILTTRIDINKRYILSASENVWTPILLNVEDNMLDNLEQQIITMLKNFIFVNDLELLPQIISVKPNKEQPNTIDLIYGFLVNYTESLNNCFWVEFNLDEEKEYSLLILEVIQNLT
jgi:hypothetical protein